MSPSSFLIKSKHTIMTFGGTACIEELGIIIRKLEVFQETLLRHFEAFECRRPLLDLSGKYAIQYSFSMVNHLQDPRFL